MTISMRHACLSLLAVACLLTACGGGGSSGSTAATPPVTPPATAPSPGGIWRGTDPSTGLALLGLVTESGEFHFLQAD
jgi:hypothetical protein